MPRMEVELTSTRDDGAWTWRAAGARQPRGSMDANLVPDGSSVGDVLRVEVEQYMDGIEVTSVLPPKGDRPAPELLEILGTGREEPLVTTKLVGRRGRRDRHAPAARFHGGAVHEEVYAQRQRRGGARGRPGTNLRGAQAGTQLPRYHLRAPAAECGGSSSRTRRFSSPKTSLTRSFFYVDSNRN